MNCFEKLSQWMSDPRPSYAEGLRLFGRLARKPAKDLFLSYLNQGEDRPRAAQLADCLRRIAEGIRLEPALYQSAYEEWNGTGRTADSRREQAIVAKHADIARHEDEIQTLQGQMQEITERNDDTEQGFSNLQDEVEEHREAIRRLEADIEELQRPGVKFVDGAEAPLRIRRAQARIKEIVPLMASLHAELSDTALTDGDRKARAAELCRLDEERRGLWQQVDTWSEGGGTPETPEETDPLRRGYEMARRIRRLRLNIVYCQRAAEEAQAAGRQGIADNAMRRIARYKQELDELTAEVGE